MQHKLTDWCAIGINEVVSGYLVHGHAYNWVIPSFRLAVNDLFIGQYCTQSCAPVDWHLCLVGQPFVEQLYEDPLSPSGHGKTAAQVSRHDAVMHMDNIKSLYTNNKLACLDHVAMACA